MKKALFTTIAAVATLTALSAQAGSSCKYDYFGNWVCNYNGLNGSGYGTTTTRKDYFGNYTTTGTGAYSTFRQTCRIDYFGNYVCN